MVVSQHTRLWRCCPTRKIRGTWCEKTLTVQKTGEIGISMPGESRLVVFCTNYFFLKLSEALRPSLPSRGTLIPKYPNRQYASSSTLLVRLLEAQDILEAMLNFSGNVWCRIAWQSMIVTSLISVAYPFLVSIGCHCLLTKTSFGGASSSCCVEPRVNDSKAS